MPLSLYIHISLLILIYPNVQVPRWMSDDNWIIKLEEMAAEHLLEKAADDLRQGRKAWLVDSKDCSVSGKEAAAVTASGITLAFCERVPAQRRRPLPASCVLQEHIKASTHTTHQANECCTVEQLQCRHWQQP